MPRHFWLLAPSSLLPASPLGPQPTKIPRIAYLGATSLTANAARVEAFRQGLRELGYVEGKNIVIELRSADGEQDRLPALVAELIRLKIDIIVSAGPSVTRAAKAATTTIPIVMTQDSDPVGSGFVASLARPGGNITGLSTLSPEISGKRLEILKEIVPKLSRVAVIGSSKEPANAPKFTRGGTRRQSAQDAASVPRRPSPKDIETAFRAAAKERADAVIVLTSLVLNSHRAQVAGTCGKKPAPGGIPRCRICPRRRAYELRREPHRPVPPRRYLCGQDPERSDARGSACRATEEIRAYHQSESREADRFDDSAERVGAGGPSH